MEKGLQQALDNTEQVYTDLARIAEDIVRNYTEDIETLVSKAGNQVESLTNDSIRELMLKLSLKSYSFGDIKERASIKATCAKALKDEKLATTFNGSEGSVVQKNNTALLSASDEILAETIYSLVAALFKTKLDELHRIVDTLKTVLMSRLSEAKLTNSFSEKDTGE